MNLERLCQAQVCPVCGHQLDFIPWSGSTETEKPCPSCGVYFGPDDRTEAKREALCQRWREHWIRSGKRWWSKQPQPPDFEPDSQLERLKRLVAQP